MDGQKSSLDRGRANIGQKRLQISMDCAEQNPSFSLLRKFPEFRLDLKKK
jgi:hypothetical protein